MCSQSLRWLRLCALCCVLLSFLPVAANGKSKIKRDGSVGPDASVAPVEVPLGSGRVFLIDDALGERRGKNLIHSFKRFSLDSGDAALFRGSPVENVITRVTGGKVSRIDGRLRSTLGESRFFFLNPAGVLFGPGAALDVGGSFYVSTADTLRFADGGKWKLGETKPLPTLSADTPSAFGFLGSAATVEFDRSQLHFADGATVQVVAGDIALDGTPVGRLIDGDLVVSDEPTIRAPGGRILLVAVDSEGEVAVDDVKPDLAEFERLGKIELVGNFVLEDDDPDEPEDDEDDDEEEDPDNVLDEIEPALALDVSGDRGGRVVLRGRVLSAQNWKISADAGNAGGESRAIDVEMRDKVLLEGATELSSIQGADALSAGLPRKGGLVRVKAPVVRLRDNAEILSDTTASDASVRAGTVRIVAGELVLKGDSEVASDADEGAAGQGGLVRIHASNIELRDGSEISSDTGGGGGGGRVEIEASGTFRIADVAGVFTNSKQAGGAGGDISIRARRFRMEGGGISAQAVGASDAGSIAIGGGERVDLEDAEITAGVFDGAGGNVTVQAEAVVAKRSLLRANARAGSGGRVEIVADLLFRDETVLDASSGDPALSGEEVINSPELDLTGSLTSLPTDFVDAASLLRPRCEARGNAATGEGSRFALVSRRGLPASPDEWIVARPESTDSVVQRVRTLQADGEYVEALHALERAAPSGSSERDALRAIEHAAVLTALARFSEADEVMAAAIDPLAPGAPADLRAALWHDRANLSAIRGHAGSARKQYAKAVAALGDGSGESTMPEIAAVVQLGAARAAIVLDDDAAAAADLLGRADVALAAPEARLLGAAPWIHLARSYALLARSNPERREAAKLSAYYALERGLRRAEADEDARSASLATGMQGELYQEQGRGAEALFLVRRALSLARRAAPELAYRWYWTEGRILIAQDQRAAGLAALRRAVAALDETRQEALARYGWAEVSFRRRVAPVYLDLVSALLQASDAGESQGGADRRDGTSALAGNAAGPLHEARAVVERYRAAELRDYFRDDCVADLAARTTPLDGVSPSAAIVYPILFPDRIELLVTLPSGLTRFSVPVDARTLAREVRRFQRGLRQVSADAYLAPAGRLFEWLVAPYLDQADSAGVDTLVFVPDGPLRGVPFSALHDGRDFLISRFAVALTPGLALVDPQPLDREDLTLLLGGLSEGVQGFEPLPQVPAELRAIRDQLGGEVLLNRGFETQAIEDAVAALRPSVVHLASHAEFGGDPESSFLLTWDGRLTMDGLAETVGRRRFADRPLELLVLSACQTAAGNERAALGLAGVAIRAGARSALGSLWSISDDAAFELVVRFYRELVKPGVSRAVALQRAQRELLEDGRFSHPFFWSPFLMISNWL